MLIRTALNARDTVFLLSDTQVVQEAFLEDVNNILNAGEVPNLLGPEDIETITAALTPVMADVGLPATKAAINSFFANRCAAMIASALPESA